MLTFVTGVKSVLHVCEDAEKANYGIQEKSLPAITIRLSVLYRMYCNNWHPYYYFLRNVKGWGFLQHFFLFSILLSLKCIDTKVIIFWLKLLCANIFSEKKKKRVHLVSIPAIVWTVMSHEQWHFIWGYEDSIESDGLNILNIILEMSAFHYMWNKTWNSFTLTSWHALL